VNTKFGFVVGTAVGDEVAEANFKPAIALSFATETLPERKVACITAFYQRLQGMQTRPCSRQSTASC
jgi:hypothetical protein